MVELGFQFKKEMRCIVGRMEKKMEKGKWVRVLDFSIYTWGPKQGVFKRKKVKKGKGTGGTCQDP